MRYSQNKATGDAKQALIEVNLSDLRKGIRNMSDDEIKNKNLDLISYFVKKILDTVKKMNNQEQHPDTTDMPELETDEDAAEKQQGQGLKILTPQQMITGLLILLAQLQAGNNSQKMETIFMNTLNSKKNDSNRFIYQFTDKLKLKNPNKNIALANLSIYCTWKILDLNTTTTNLKFLQLGMMNLIYTMYLILFLIFNIILNTSLKNMKIFQIILLYKFM